MRGNRSLGAKERFPRTPFKKAGRVGAGNKKSPCFSANGEKKKGLNVFLAVGSVRAFF